jgi:hypothetical protein
VNRRIVVAYASTIAALSGIAAYRWSVADVAGHDDDFLMPRAPARSAMVGQLRDSALSELEQMIVTNDPFRLANAPSSVAYDPGTDGASGTMAALPAFRPALALRAIVGGPPWQAIIDGIPGQPAGTVVGDGMAFGRLTVRSVTRDSVIIQGPDTLWVLAFREHS